VEVIEGLQAGDVVVTAGQQRIQKDGMPVRVLEVGRGPGAGNGGAPGAGPGSAPGPGTAPAATAGSAPGASAVAMPVAATAAPAASAKPAGKVAAGKPVAAGPNPCNMNLADGGATPRQPRGARSAVN
jgi:membrane fusion protein (multidrug efflux system)